MSSVTVDKVCYWYCSGISSFSQNTNLNFKMFTGAFELTLLMNVEFMMDIKESAK